MQETKMEQKYIKYNQSVYPLFMVWVIIVDDSNKKGQTGKYLLYESNNISYL